MASTNSIQPTYKTKHQKVTLHEKKGFPLTSVFITMWTIMEKYYDKNNGRKLNNFHET